MTDTGTALRLPIATLPTTVLPGATVTLTLDDPSVRQAIEAAGGGRLAFRAPRVGDPVGPEIVVVARVPSTGSLPGGAPAAVVQIESRGRLVQLHTSERGADHADVEPLADVRPTPRVEALVRELTATLQLVAELRRSRRLPELLRSGPAPGALADGVATWAEFDDEQRLELLDAVDVGARVDLVLAWAKDHLAELQVAETIRNDVSEGVDQQQREYLLRQQLAAIRKELGEGDDDVVADYRERLGELDAADGVKQAIDKELDRLERTSAQSPEHGWIRTWLDRIFELPWGERSDDTLDLDVAAGVLDDDHYGLDDVKDRIVEFLATRKLRHERGVESAGRGNGAIITLVGPPGVGKTSLGESAARAMGREFVRVALGGIRDEAEIRGHRRTYVGSQPGRIVRALTEAGTMNPVILLDEVDKLSPGGWSGDPTAALLEVLDPAQNHTFRDHYLEVDLDLSEVVFIATANVADTIPAPLLDRMDLVRLDGYTEDEKVFIARRYLLPRQIERAGLREDEVDVPDEAIAAIVRGYTREAGVRGLERELGKLVRKVTAKVAGGAGTPLAIEPDDLTTWIGRPKVVDDVPERTQLPGVATGLAVTGHGGDVLFIETTGFPTADGAEPGLTLTGQLGDVMKESAQIALNFVRSHADELGVDVDRLQQRFHVHVPAGAVPKDGPSAGITMTTALVSLLTDRPLKDSVGMTGEITLQGAVLPIGGVKQKVLAAHRAGLREVVLPKRNGPDIEDVPERVRDEMTFYLADRYDDVLAAAF
ncbi:MAG: endopeptidase La [Ilumatobacter sp.]|uniref:endopeptidase La n=1 Tax=Ilumatobacter sp. TaxID=1967498 RepID=UPI002616ABAE|nr:endopeptidase La [Ilumatobacter sp.]MDJ0769277.1 endopeptidase La [Ilumatobacter sp.]